MADQRSSSRGSPVRGVIIIIVIVVIGALWAYGHFKSASIKSWCEKNIRFGSYMGNLKMPQSNLESIQNGTWTYFDGTTITFSNSHVVDYTCG